MPKTIIIGGAAGGATAATRLRRLDENMEILLLEKGEYISYANCGMPYFIGGIIQDKQELTLMTPLKFTSHFNIDVRTKNEVIAIDRNNKTITIQDHNKDRTYQENYDYLILSTGAAPIIPKGVKDFEGVFTLRDIPDTLKIKAYIEDSKPNSAVVIGGGPIGLEVAENLIQANVSTTVIELADHVVAPFDFDMASFLHKYLREKGINLILNNSVNEIIRKEKKISLKLNDKIIQTDMVIVSIGVRPVSKLAVESGLEANQKGAVIVNNRMQTNDSNIYAIGDLVEIRNYITGDKAYVPLAGPAQKQARIAADNIMGKASEYYGSPSCGIVKIFDKTVAFCGLNEKLLKAKNIDYEKIYIYTPSHPSYYPDSGFITIKLMFDKNSGKILGAQLIGDRGVDKRADVLATVIRMNGTINDLTELELPYSPPYSSAKDPVNIAGLTAQNVIEKVSDVFHYEDLQNIDPKTAELLDVRRKKEYEKGHIEGFKNIPLHELRQRVNELDKNKIVYVICFVGQRAYIAERILKGLGFKAVNFSGGYRLYKSIYNEKNINN